MTQYNIPIPDTPEDWLQEIISAYADAKETIPFSSITGADMTEDDLYHLAPAVCLKFRGIKNNKKVLKQATEAALSSYVVTSDVNQEMQEDSMLAFGFCYLCSHFGLGIINENQSNEIIEYIEKELLG